MVRDPSDESVLPGTIHAPSREGAGIPASMIRRTILAVVKNDPFAHRHRYRFVGLEQRFPATMISPNPCRFRKFSTNDAVQATNALVGKRHHTVLEQVVQAFNDAKIFTMKSRSAVSPV